jgi:hypothetical protein
MDTDKSTITTLSFRDEMMSHGRKEDIKAHGPKHEEKQLPTRKVENISQGGDHRRISPMQGLQQRDIPYSPMPPAKPYCTSDMRSPISTVTDWSTDKFQSFEPPNIRLDHVRSTVRRTHSAPQDLAPHQPPRRQRATRRFSRPMIQVLPGKSMPLIGFSESKHYFRQGNCVRTSCMECTMSLYCAMDATYMLCTVCESISPLRHGEPEHPLLGFGVTMDQISE